MRKELSTLCGDTRRWSRHFCGSAGGQSNNNTSSWHAHKRKFSCKLNCANKFEDTVWRGSNWFSSSELFCLQFDWRRDSAASLANDLPWLLLFAQRFGPKPCKLRLTSTLPPVIIGFWWEKDRLLGRGILLGHDLFVYLFNVFLLHYPFLFSEICSTSFILCCFSCLSKKKMTLARADWNSNLIYNFRACAARALKHLATTFLIALLLLAQQFWSKWYGLRLTVSSFKWEKLEDETFVWLHLAQTLLLKEAGPTAATTKKYIKFVNLNIYLKSLML